MDQQSNGHNPDFSKIPDLGELVGANTLKGVLRRAIKEIPETSKEVMVIYTDGKQVGFMSNMDLVRGLQVTDVLHYMLMKQYTGG